MPGYGKVSTRNRCGTNTAGRRRNERYRARSDADAGAGYRRVARATTDVMPFKDEAQEQQFRQLTEQLLPEMPEQQHCGLERDDSHRHVRRGV